MERVLRPQRGGLVDVSLHHDGFVYRGVVRSSSKRYGVHVVVEHGDSTMLPGARGGDARVDQRRGLLSFRLLFALVQAYA